MATTGTFRAEERRASILASLERDGAVQLEQVAADLGVSSMTVRRDLDELEADGLLRRVRGGAVSVLRPRPFKERRAVRSRAKHAIAEKAVALIPSSGAIALDASTTAGTIGSALGARAGLTVATNSYENFQTVRAVPGVTPVLVGGEAEEATDSFVGLIACQAAASMLYQRFFASASAVDVAHGTSEVSLAESQVKRAFADGARETVLCIDFSKLGQQSVALSFPLSEISIMITDLDPRDSRLDEYRHLVELR
jgi:DeoR family fructose operon transcriptional repressor